MKLLSALLLSSAPVQIWAASLPLFGQSPIKSLEDTFPVAGENPLEYCADPKNDILEIVSVNLTPNPPVPYVLKNLYINTALAMWYSVANISVSTVAKTSPSKQKAYSTSPLNGEPRFTSKSNMVLSDW